MKNVTDLSLLLFLTLSTTDCPCASNLLHTTEHHHHTHVPASLKQNLQLGKKISLVLVNEDYFSQQTKEIVQMELQKILSHSFSKSHDTYYNIAVLARPRNQHYAQIRIWPSYWFTPRCLPNLISSILGLIQPEALYLSIEIHIRVLLNVRK